MTTKQLVERINALHTKVLMHQNEAAKAAVLVGEQLFKLRATMHAEGKPWVTWLETNLPKISQRSIYNYIKCYTISLEEPERASGATSIREMLGDAGGKPVKMLSTTKLQRIVLAIAAEFEPDPRARALAHAVMGTESKIPTIAPLIADWTKMLQFTPAIK